MVRFSRGFGLAVGLLVLASAGGAGAQDNLDRGKTGAQLYASDCAICHKTPQKLALGNAGGIFGLGSFLREHYTASRESAAVIAAYLNGIRQSVAGAPARHRVPKRAAKPAEHRKPAAARSAQAKPHAKKPKSAASTKSKQPE